MYDLNIFNLGEKLKELRKKQNMTLDQFGDLIGKSKSTIYKYEENSVTPDFVTLLEICNKLNITIEKLCDFEPIEEDSTKSKNPFNSNNLYLYYIGYRGKLICSSIKVEKLANKLKVIFKNSYKDRINKNNTFVNSYIGILESDKSVTYINLKNDYETNQRYEKIQIVLDLKHSVDYFYIGSISATTDSNNPTTRKCILTTEKIDDRDDLNYIFEKLKVSKEELEEIRKNNYWNMPINILEEYFDNTENSQ